MVKQGKSSDILEELYGKAEYYESLLTPYTTDIRKRYPHPILNKLFGSLGKRMIAVCPMAFCNNLLKDLNKTPEAKDLAALGLHMLAISTHDDIADEMPKDRIKLASLLYAGNIATNEASKILVEQGNIQAAKVLLDAVNDNHFYQQHVVETLWQRAPKSFKEYRDGINHICVFSGIGLKYALALAGREDLTEKIDNFANGYGVALQLIDDLREVNEDKRIGYWSFPITEGEPYKKSFEELFKHIKICKEAIPSDWKNLLDLAERLEKFAYSINEH